MKASIVAILLSLSSALAAPVADAEAEAAPAQNYGTYPNYGWPSLLRASPHNALLTPFPQAHMANTRTIPLSTRNTPPTSARQKQRPRQPQLRATAVIPATVRWIGLPCD